MAPRIRGVGETVARERTGGAAEPPGGRALALTATSAGLGVLPSPRSPGLSPLRARVPVYMFSETCLSELPVAGRRRRWRALPHPDARGVAR